jgi:hypothetical protein
VPLQPASWATKAGRLELRKANRKIRGHITQVEGNPSPALLRATSRRKTLVLMFSEIKDNQNSRVLWVSLISTLNLAANLI